LIPKELFEESAKLENEGYVAWVKAKKESNFLEFAPFISKWVELKIKTANLIDPNIPVLDVLIDEFDPEMKTERLDVLFEQVKEFLVPFIQKIKQSKVIIFILFIYYFSIYLLFFF
jgi:carboxypeptidase Taq